MPKASVRPEQEQIVAFLYDAFVDRDYPTCNARVFDLGMTMGFRYFTFILSMGLGFRINDEPSLQAVLIYTISHLRLGDYQAAEGVLQLHQMSGGTKGWVTELVSLALRREGFDKVLTLAETDEQKLQAHYYEAEARLTDRDPTGALLMFQRCLDIASECPERKFADARVKWLRSSVYPC